MAMSTERFTRRKDVKSKIICAKEERNASLKKVSLILQKSKELRTTDEEETLVQCSEAVDEVRLRWKRRDMAKQRTEEIEEPDVVIEEKCKLLAQAIAQSHHLIVYTGAGISTAARIPDYRGKDGIWTRLQQGKDIGNHDLSLAEPTYTHMALSTLHKKHILKYVVSQNCDGLHLRSGLPKQALSELHGNMYIEVCKNCKPVREYWRLFDVTENTGRYFHKTMRKCYVCNHALVDTIVHFGERGSLHWPLNWTGACNNAKKADTILCLGSSLKVLKKYPWLWQMDKPAKRRPNLYIVNLQWTPKDDVATVKIHGKCDQIMRLVMKYLGIDADGYSRENDPIFVHASTLHELELHTTTQPLLKLCKDDDDDDDDCDKKDSTMQVEQLSIPNSIFSIDSILNGNETASVSTNATTDGNLQTLLAYYQYQMTTSLLHNQMFGYQYRDIGFYPYQTSFLYPGLHSIISPSPFYGIDIKPNLPLLNVDATLETIAAKSNDKPSCGYCDRQFQSVVCMYYLPIECSFMKQEYRYSKSLNGNKVLVCVCCDCSTDEDSGEEMDSSSNAKVSKNDDKTSVAGSDCEGGGSECFVVDANEGKINKVVNAGWFGKGYKKNRKYKKKISSTS